MKKRSKGAVICMPSYRGMSRAAVKLAARLEERHGWPWPDTVGDGYSDVGKARDVLASHFLADPKLKEFEWSFWMDDDMLIPMASVINAFNYVRSNGLRVCNLLAVPGKPNAQTFACRFAEADIRENGTRYIKCGTNGRHYQAESIGFGLVFVHRSVFQEMADKGASYGVVTQGRDRAPMLGWEFFPRGMRVGKRVVVDGVELPSSAGEDYGFSAMCEACGIPIHILTKYRCWHIHDYPYTWENAFLDVPRGSDGHGNDDLEVEI